MKKLITSIFRSPVLGGGLLSICFYVMVHQGIITNELIRRYTAGHEVEYITVTMFFIGMVSLFGSWLKLGKENRSLGSGLIFPPIGEHPEELERVELYLETLKKAEKVRGRSLFIKRLRDALNFLKHNGTAADLEQELRYLSEEDGFRADSHYGMVRMFIWAIPILGFLGTVIGITMALGNLNLTELETTGKLLAEGLQVAFDTTALALSLVFVLYFSLFFVRGRESVFFQKLDSIVVQELGGRFLVSEKEETGSDVESVHRVLKTVVDSFEILMKRQTTLWEEAIQSVNERTDQMARSASQQIDLELQKSLTTCLDRFSQQLVEGQKQLHNESIHPLLDKMDQKTEKLGAFKDQMIQEESILLEVLRAMGEITRLEDRLNHNLNTLAGVGNFEETVNSLAAAIHLLNTKINGISSTPSEIRLAASPERPVLHGSSEEISKVIPITSVTTDI